MENIAASKAAFIRPVTKINAFSREFSFDESDCSNPQQGTGRGLNSPCMAQSPLTLAVGLVRNGMPSPPTSSECDYSAVMQKGAEEVAGRTQEVRLALKIPPTSKDNRKLFVGGLPMDVTSEEFFTFFKQFGTVLDSVVMFDRETRKPRGFGFVTFEDAAVCCRLLQTGKKRSVCLDEETGNNNITVNASTLSSGRLEMRGKMIEIKAAQPKEESTISQLHQKPSQRPCHNSYGTATLAVIHEMDHGHHQPRPHCYDPGVYDHASKYPATLPRFKYSSRLYGFAVPPNSVPYYADPMTPTPPQATLDMSHHMMFYSHLLATPTLMMSPLVSPMMSPMVLGYDHYYGQHFQFNHGSPHVEPTLLTEKSIAATPTPVVPEIRKVQPGQAFRIGNATFYPEAPPSPRQGG